MYSLTVIKLHSEFIDIFTENVFLCVQHRDIHLEIGPRRLLTVHTFLQFLQLHIHCSRQQKHQKLTSKDSS